jgi:tetratricopeptide (TPR) repeat protein
VPEAYRIVHWLDPFASASKRSSLYLMREFCLATAELVSVKLQTASDRYSRLLEVFQGKVLGLDELHLEQFRCGCLHGKAQALVTNTSPQALEVADELERRGTFFAPHAAGVRMTYHMYRGEAHKALPHRQRAEALALRGGTSWSAISVLTIRMVQGCVMTGDVVGLVHVVADLERLAKLAPSLAAIYELAQGHLELMRGHPERALPIYERVLASESARALPSYPVERALQVQALSALGQHQAARTLCLALMEEVASSGRDSDHIVLLSRQRLARAEAGLGNFERAAELVDSCFERAKQYDNPLTLGIVHRERAQVAVMAGDSAAFELHQQAMREQFALTENPWLIQQYDALRTQGVRAGVRRASMPDGRAMEDLDGATAIKTAVEQPRVSEAATLERSRTRLGSGHS